MFFVGILDGKDGAFGVRVPDVPGCHGGGGTVEDAIADAISALSAMSEQASAAVPRSAAAIAADPEASFDAANGESLVMLPYLAASGRQVRANISLDERHLEAIDKAAALRNLTRSSFLVDAALDKIANGG